MKILISSKHYLIALGSFTSIGLGISYLLGGIDSSLIALFIFIALDFIIGLFNALILKKSKKTKHGKASSAQGIKGIIKKIYILFMIVVAQQLDILLGSNFVRDGAIIGFGAMEVLSIIENITFAGVPVPNIIKNALEILNKKEEEKEKKKDDDLGNN